MINVYHLNDDLFVNELMSDWTNVDKRYLDAQMGFNKSAQVGVVTQLFNEGSYVLVAKVDTADLSKAWDSTNHIDDSWLNNSNVEPLVEKARSSRVGDVFKDDDGQFHVVASIGFECLSGIVEKKPKAKM